MLPFPHMFYLFTHELAGLRRWCLALSRIPARAFDRFTLWHNLSEYALFYPKPSICMPGAARKAARWIIPLVRRSGQVRAIFLQTMSFHSRAAAL